MAVIPDAGKEDGWKLDIYRKYASGCWNAIAFTTVLPKAGHI